MLDRNGKKELIQRELSQIVGSDVSIRIEIEPAAPSPPEAEAPPRREPAPVPPAPASAVITTSIRLTPELKEQLRSDPLVAAVIDELGGEIVKVE